MTASLRRKTRFTLAVGMRLCLVCMSAQILLPHRTTAQVNADTEEWVSKGESLLAQEKRQPTLRADRVAAFGEAARRLAQQLPSIPETSGVYPVSYTHLDVYKRQLLQSSAVADGHAHLQDFFFTTSAVRRIASPRCSTTVLRVNWYGPFRKTAASRSITRTPISRRRLGKFPMSAPSIPRSKRNADR